MWGKLVSTLLTVLEYIFKTVDRKREENENEKIRSSPDSYWVDEFGVKRLRNEDKDSSSP